MIGGRELVEYEIQLEAFETLSVDGVSSAVVKIVFRRRMEYHVTNTFLQTMILVGIGFMSYYFELDNFSDRVMVALTTMLVVATIMSSTQSVSQIKTIAIIKYVYIEFRVQWAWNENCPLSYPLSDLET